MNDQTKLGSLILVGVNHTTAPLDVRERLAIPVARLADGDGEALANVEGRGGVVHADED